MGHNTSDGYLSNDDRDSKTSDQRDNHSISEKPTYVLEHLATFKLNKETGISTPYDGMKHLLDMNQTTGIWSQKMQICFDNEWVLIMDYETGNVIEGFPGSLIQEPTAFLCNDPMEIYNNILVFTVGGSLAHTEMHIFQCRNISAKYLVEDLKKIRNGKTVTKRHESVPVTPTKTTKNSLRDQYGLKEMNSISNEVQANFENDIILLNHCFEDIEKFVARLHSAAGANRELENRMQHRGTPREKNYGEGLLTLRSRLPTEIELLDILAKFKLSFNLITTLKSNIKDTKVPIHYLFTSLELIVQVCNEVNREASLPSQVVSPLLTYDTIELLLVAVTVKEHDLWRSLGDAWNVPKEQWKGRVKIYQPIFYDGWSPILYDGDESDGDDDSNIALQAPVLQRTIENRVSFNTDAAVWLKRLESRNVEIAEVTYSREASNNKELSVEKGEFLEILDDSRKWWRVRNNRGQIGHVPYTILVQHNYEGRMKHQSQQQILFQQGNEYREKTPSIKEPIKAPALLHQEDNAQVIESQRKSIAGRSVSMPNVPPPPPPPPVSAPTTPSATLKRSAPLAIYAATTIPRTKDNDDDNDNDPSTEDVQEELKHVLMMREKRKDLEILVTPQIYIEQSSTPSEIEAWLRGKGFSSKIIKKLHGINGNEIFALSPDTLEDYFGIKEGRRLVSQLVLQKSFSGFKTARSSELEAMLARARQKTGETNLDEVF